MEVLHANAPYNLFGIDPVKYSNAKIVVLPVPYDSTTSYRTGARDGPRAIITASRHVELYNEELGADISDMGICTLEELEPDIDTAEGMMKRIAKEVGNILDDKKIPLLIGGEHSISIGAQMAIAKKEKEFSVLHFDAHSDSRLEYMGSKYSHACVTARAREICGSCFSVGVRSVEIEGAQKHGKEMLFRKDMHKMAIDEIVEHVCKNTRKKIYLTIDVDVLDSSIMPSTGTPEPDGLTFYELSSILRGVLQRKEIIGMDFTELSPIGGMVGPDFLVAKLIYLSLGYAFYLPKK